MYSIIKNTIHSWNASLARFRDIQKISTHVVEVSSKLIKEYHQYTSSQWFTYYDNQCVIQNNLITSGQT